MTGPEIKKHYRDITFRENSARLKLLNKFRDLVRIYFDNSTLNMIDGSHAETQEAQEARASINLIMNSAYQIIRLADIKTSTASTPLFSAGGKSQNIDLILNIFNLGRNNIPPDAAIDYIERAIDVYKSNKLNSFMRTVNPFYWMTVFLARITGGFRKQDQV